MQRNRIHQLFDKRFSLVSVGFVFSLFVATSSCTTNTQEPKHEPGFYESFDSIGRPPLVDDKDKRCHHIDKGSEMECSDKKNGCTEFRCGLWDDTCHTCNHLATEHY